MNLAKLKTLVVDDMSSMRMMIKSVLRDNGIVDIVEAADGEKAVELLAKGRIDLVICDWDMPNMNGLAFLRHVRADAAMARLPFIMLTANADRDHVERAIEAGVSDYLAKPFKPPDLIRKVLRVLR
ncbi:MAG: response regulator [Gammaproteobacteria bacterium]|nr:response regulator [Gammaproteobacteria bacterium]MCB1924057.1 response regulator [Gammaproteobacteria bacterium]